jgi:dTDP-glucose 4,6-dehydratase
LVDRISSILGSRPTIQTDADRLRPPKSEVMRLSASNRKAKEMMGWAPRVALDVGLEQTTNWIRQHLDAYRPNEYAV